MRNLAHLNNPQLEQDLLISIPAWEEEAGRPFLVHGESIMSILSATASAHTIDKENKHTGAGGKNGTSTSTRAGSAPPVRATTPINSSNHYVPGSRNTSGGKGVVTPAVRAGSVIREREGSNKRQKMVDATPRTVLGTHRGTNTSTKNASPTKVPGSRSVSVPKKLSAHTTTMMMPVPRPGTQHHALGHGRLPTSTARSVSASVASVTRTRVPSGTAKKPAARTKLKRESFKPRPSADHVDHGWDKGHGARYGGFAGASVKEEEEVY